MLIAAAQFASPTSARSDVTVVGTGPAGIVCALELVRHGCDVTLVESGLRQFSAKTQALGDCDQFDPRRQAPMVECTRRQLGGTSVIWAGRCVPFDPIDFEPRPYIPEAEWPIRYSDISPYFSRASYYLLCGAPLFNSYLLPDLRKNTSSQISPTARFAAPIWNAGRCQPTLASNTIHSCATRRGSDWSRGSPSSKSVPTRRQAA